MHAETECSLVIPAEGMEETLVHKIAGLTLLERICRTAQKAGFSGVTVISSRPGLLDFSCDSVAVISTERSLAAFRCARCVVLKTGYLPDVNFLRELCAASEPGRQYTVPGQPVIFICSSSHFSYVSTFFLRKNSFEEALRETGRGAGTQELHVRKGRIFNASDASAIPGVEDVLFRGLVKDTEGFMSRHVERRISIAISRRLVNTSVTPNEMTLISVLVGVAGAAFVYMGQGSWQIAGALLFLAHSILDGCDGEIARIKFQQSRMGGILDFWGDNVVHAAVFWAIGQEWYNRTGEITALVLAWLAVLSTFASAGLIYIKTMHRKEEKDGPMYTSVSAEETKDRISIVADFLSRRDFIYLVVILAFFHHLDWFIIMAGIGSPLFFMVLLWLNINGKRADHS